MWPHQFKWKCLARRRDGIFFTKTTTILYRKQTNKQKANADLTRITASALHTVQWKNLVNCNCTLSKFKIYIYIVKKTVMETQRVCEERKGCKNKTCVFQCVCMLVWRVCESVWVSVCGLVLPSICAQSVSVIARGCVRGPTPRLTFVSVCVPPLPSCWCHQYARCDWWQSLPQSDAPLLNVLFVY